MLVVGEAGDGLAALRLIKQLRPDVVTMDVLMPIMGGPESIRRVMAECPTPIVVFAAAQTDQRLAWLALEYGATEVFAKPTSGLDAVDRGQPGGRSATGGHRPGGRASGP